MRFKALTEFVSKEIIDSFKVIWDHLGQPGSWWTGPQRIAIAEHVRRSAPRPLWDKAPRLETLSDATEGELSNFEMGVVERVAVEPSSIDREVYTQIVTRMGEDKYAELAAVVSQVVPIDHLHDALGIDREKLPIASDGNIAMERPEGLVFDVGFLPTLPSDGLPHVAVALSLALADNARRMLLVRAMYSGQSFFDMVWTHRSLSRPQIELVAARTSALNECFY
ncbi:MAG: hypothetical protein VX725_04490 [Actinomycetota bacterium]|nr:hypothetical protein [Actinomycetota bacterium]